jgi:hypothetical protein
VLDRLITIVAQATSLPPAALTLTLRPPLSIQANRLYDVWVDNRHLIVKEFLLPDEQLDAPAREFGALTLLAPLDIAPQPVFYQPALGPVVVYEYMEGEMWDRRRPAVDELEQLAALWLEMNAVTASGLWLSHGSDRPLAQSAALISARLRAYAEWVATEFTPGRRAAELCLALLDRRADLATALDGADPVVCFCRADPRFANVIQRPDGRLGLIDWEDCGLRDPARELADLLAHPNQEDLLTLDDWQAFVRPYVAERGRSDPGLLHRMHLYLALFPLFWLSVITSLGLSAARAGQWRDWQVNGLPANLRLRRFLARAVAWPNQDFALELEHLEDLVFFPDN